VRKNQLLLETPLIEINSFLLKREDLNPSGSVKDRAVIKQLAWAKKNGYSQVAISSSGNAGISVAYWAPQFSSQATIFVSPKINPAKLKKINNLKAEIKVTSRPISDCVKFCFDKRVLNLRQSRDPRAIRGFSELGEDLAKQLLAAGKKQAALFFPVSSGATLCGTTKGVLKTGLPTTPFIVQPASHPILARTWDSQFSPEKKHLTDALVARVLPLKKEIMLLIKQTGGGGLVIQNKKILKWHRWLTKRGVSVALEGALALAGVEKARKLGLISPKLPAVCLLTGKLYSNEKSSN